ncbi:hypothetical protein PR048_001024 [Dryococelus australis]|uniref:Uncharacterized protein n=1 Tax=Dryococelus australis TaxID=614101 RepID=A0ABQ9IIM9_9NEOP|nr:hypothetical protein PR048_001024 [Dryococelus australis]
MINHKKLLVKLVAAGFSNYSWNYKWSSTGLNSWPIIALSLYITALASYFKHVKCYQYADDTQLLLSYRVNEIDKSIVKIKSD